MVLTHLRLLRSRGSSLPASLAARDQVWAELLPLRSVALYETARLLPPCPPASWLKVPVTVASAARLRPSQS